MASSQHLHLSTFIKNVHEQLRQDSKTLGSEEAWKRHCENHEVLTNYAAAMRNLATNHWENNYRKEGSKAISRVEWVYGFIRQYYEGEILHQRKRETSTANKLGITENIWPELGKEKLLVLDVGSCYNPFKAYPGLEVTAIDLTPACDDVLQCDFLNVKIIQDTAQNTPKTITELQFNSFDIVVFSLLLEYLPSPLQRKHCCENAYDLLKYEGLLIIITPDSKHTGANAQIMKSWRYVLQLLGFSRIKYEKLPYLHCMAFRKTLKKEVAQRWSQMRAVSFMYNELVIPQDFKSKSESCEKAYQSDVDLSLFNELPLLNMLE